MTQFVTAVLFDLDGTLIDTAADFVRIIRKMSEENGWQAPSDTAIREQVSAGASAMVGLMLEHNAQTVPSDDALGGYRQQFLDEYAANICIDSCLFDSLDDTIARLEDKDVPWGIVTNKPRYLAEKLLEMMGLDERCAVLVCPEDVSRKKPDPEPMYLALEKLGISRGAAASVVYVGDHVRDIEAGAAAGMPTILAAYGYIPPEDRDDLKQWGADFIAKTPKDVGKILFSTKNFEY